MFQQQSHIEQIARMLSIQGRTELARIEVIQMDDRHLDIAELCLHRWAHASHSRLAHTSTQYRRDLNLHSRAATPCDKCNDLSLGTRAFYANTFRLSFD